MFDDLIIKEAPILTEEEVKSLRNYLVFILDRSGSMHGKEEAIAEFYNEQIKAAKEHNAGMKTTVWRRFFDNVPGVLIIQDLDDVEKMTVKDIIINGSTALFDTVGFTIRELLKEPHINDEKTSVVFVIITDGQENNSVEFNAAKLKSLTEELEKSERWTFLYLGTDHDVYNQGFTITQNYGNMFQYTNTVEGVRSAGGLCAASISNYYVNRTNFGTTSIKGAFTPEQPEDDTLKPATTYADQIKNFKKFRNQPDGIWDCGSAGVVPEDGAGGVPGDGPIQTPAPPIRKNYTLQNDPLSPGLSHRRQLTIDQKKSRKKKG